MKETISMKLFNTLKKGKKQLDKVALEKIIGFVESQRASEGSFIDKSGKPDLYYTVFGWMLSYVLGIHFDNKKANTYLSSFNAYDLDLIHYSAYMRCKMILNLFSGSRLLVFLNSLVSTKVKVLSNFNGIPHDDMQSPYTQFIWLSLLEDTGNRLIETSGILNLLNQYGAVGGGYMNTKEGLTATTNATVAALTIRGQLEGYYDNPDVQYLLGLQKATGGFGAAKASPLPDLLSTATSLFLLSCYRVQPNYPAHDFVEAHWLNSGGFSATLLDDSSDVEYTFYGLLALGALQ